MTFQPFLWSSETALDDGINRQQTLPLQEEAPNQQSVLQTSRYVVSTETDDEDDSKLPWYRRAQYA